MRKYTLRTYPKGGSRVASRTLEVPGTATLDDLCGHILDAFDFDRDHLYEFCMDNRMYGDHSYQRMPDYGEPSTDIALDAVGLRKGQNFSLHYDFGDDWMFTIHVNRIEEVDAEVRPRVVASKGHVEQYPSWDEEDEEIDW